MKFRPCIDLHEGVVKQIVGGTLSDAAGVYPRINFKSDHPASYFANLYRQDGLNGGHIIMLGRGNEMAAAESLAAWPGGMQLGGGITPQNAAQWLDRGAYSVIVTSYVFRDGCLDWSRLKEMTSAIGRERLVLDLSCRKRDGQYYIVTDRWQTFTTTTIDARALDDLSDQCAEFLVHAADVEGLCRGVEEDLVSLLGQWSPIPTTYAGGVRNFQDIRLVQELGKGRLDVTVGSALDLFGGNGIRYTDLLAFNQLARNAV